MSAKRDDNEEGFLFNLETIASLLGLTMEELLEIVKADDPDEDDCGNLASD